MNPNMNPFDKYTADLAALATLTATAAQVFNGDEVISVRSYHDRIVSVQMREADLLAWCEAHGLTPSVSESEADYTRYGGGFALHRYYDVVVHESAAGRILLVSAEQVSTRAVPAPAAVVEAGAAA